MTKIAIIGLGLIGGSLGIDLCAKGLEVVGVSRNPETCRRAREHKAVTQASVELDILTDVDIVFICTPLGAISLTCQKLIPYLQPHTVVTDVGSVKTPIVRECSELWTNFIGGHPMAGTAEQGIEAAQKGLFVNAPYVLTPIASTPPEITEKLSGIVQLLDSKLYFSSPENHDQAVAWISHLPVMISASLIQACMSETETDILNLAQQLASSGFRDTSRVGGGNPELGVMMACYNQEALARSLLAYRESLDTIIETINRQDWQALNQIFETTQVTRNFFC